MVYLRKRRVNKKNENIKIDYDNKWKVIISNLFEDFINFFVPNLCKLVDFQSPIVFLEQELHKLIDDKIKRGKVINDKLVKVKLKGGEEKWILIHIEVQSSYEVDFSERMFTYFYRIYDRYNQKITAIAIYTGARTPKEYSAFNYEFSGTRLLYEFNSYKITTPKQKELLVSDNPFALVVLTCQYLLKTKNNLTKRLAFKLKLIRLAKDKKYSDRQIVNLLRFIDFILVLPRELEQKFQKEIIDTYIKPKEMNLTEAQIEFANKVHVALYGETIKEKVVREETEKFVIEKTISIQKLIRNSDLSNSKIAEIFNTTTKFVNEIRKNMSLKK